jgi:hypothetical protein
MEKGAFRITARYWSGKQRPARELAILIAAMSLASRRKSCKDHRLRIRPMRQPSGDLFLAGTFGRLCAACNPTLEHRKREEGPTTNRWRADRGRTNIRL